MKQNCTPSKEKFLVCQCMFLFDTWPFFPWKCTFFSCLVVCCGVDRVGQTLSLPLRSPTGRWSFVWESVGGPSIISTWWASIHGHVIYQVTWPTRKLHLSSFYKSDINGNKGFVCIYSCRKMLRGATLSKMINTCRL